jgi:hypothetical protein
MSTERKLRQIATKKLAEAKHLQNVDTCDPHAAPPPGAVMADAKELAHNNTYGRLPSFYVDKVVVCRQCGAEEIWPAARQKWWYEVAKGNINTQAVLCSACRAAEKDRRERVRQAHLAGLARKADRSQPRRGSKKSR